MWFKGFKTRIKTIRERGDFKPFSSASSVAKRYEPTCMVSKERGIEMEEFHGSHGETSYEYPIVSILTNSRRTIRYELDTEKRPNAGPQ